MNTRWIKNTTMLAAMGMAFGLPLAASADSSSGVWSGDAAAPVPHIPGTFANSPTNDDPNTGQFSATFDTTGRLIQVGRSAEPPEMIEVAGYVSARQVVSTRDTGDSAASEATFASFKTQLRSLSRLNGQTAQR
ncbi:MAG: hypothetical protein IAI50_03320 [Candidatus Eremiobacteraeota bacterium]|nr:hypothetical protein [Candidatus Eremiobacteraeota bacterium]